MGSGGGDLNRGATSGAGYSVQTVQISMESVIEANLSFNEYQKQNLFQSIIKYLSNASD